MGDGVATVTTYSEEAMDENIMQALPRKRFFIEMFTRDISLEDCLLELIDNSIDGFIRSRNIDFDWLDPTKGRLEDLVSERMEAQIDLTISPDEIVIRDNCGGIDLDLARKEVFSFGHTKTWNASRGLGAYGIGLKRAIFKLGDAFQLVS